MSSIYTIHFLLAMINQVFVVYWENHLSSMVPQNILHHIDLRIICAVAFVFGFLKPKTVDYSTIIDKILQGKIVEFSLVLARI